MLVRLENALNLLLVEELAVRKPAGHDVIIDLLSASFMTSFTDVNDFIPLSGNVVCMVSLFRYSLVIVLCEDSETCRVTSASTEPVLSSG